MQFRSINKTINNKYNKKAWQKYHHAKKQYNADHTGARQSY